MLNISYSGNPERNEKLKRLASFQYGYFTASQARNIGYTNALHLYHIQHKNWLYIDKGLYRLPGYQDTIESEFTKWTLWSRDQKNRPQAIIGLWSVLKYFSLIKEEEDIKKLSSLSQYYIKHNLEQIHLIVPKGFRKIVPDKVKIYKIKEKVKENQIIKKWTWDMTTIQRAIEDIIISQDVPQEVKDYLKKLIKKESPQIEITNNDIFFSIKKESMNDISSSKSSPKKDYRKPEELPLDKKSHYSVNIEADQKRRFLIALLITKLMDWLESRSLSRRYRIKRGPFTLIELIVVIGIITVLASLLLPSLYKAREYAKKTLCVSNLRQIGLAMSSYANIYNNILAPPTGWGSDVHIYTNKYYWDYWAGRYYFNYPVTNSGWCPHRDAWPIFRCPTDTIPRHSKWTNRSYAMVLCLMYVTTSPGRGRKLQEIKHPSRRYFISEEDRSNSRYSNAVVGISGAHAEVHLPWGSYIAAYHLGFANFLFVDGHVEGKKTWNMGNYRGLNDNSLDPE